MVHKFQKSNIGKDSSPFVSKSERHQVLICRQTEQKAIATWKACLHVMIYTSITVQKFEQNFHIVNNFYFHWWKKYFDAKNSSTTQHYAYT